MIFCPLLSFCPRTHTYSVQGRQLRSVSSRVSSCFAQFDADATIARMRANEEKFASGPYAHMTDAQIKSCWRKKGERAALTGTDFHSHVENYLNGESELPTGREFDQFKQFARDFGIDKLIGVNVQCDRQRAYLKYKSNAPHLQCESRVYYNDTAGTIDCVQFHSPTEVTIYDWKRSIKAFDKNSYGRTSIHSYIDLPDAPYYRYALQLNLYRAILNAMGYTVRAMYLVQFHPDIATYRAEQVNEIVEADLLI